MNRRLKWALVVSAGLHLLALGLWRSERRPPPPVPAAPIQFELVEVPVPAEASAVSPPRAAPAAVTQPPPRVAPQPAAPAAVTQPPPRVVKAPRPAAPAGVTQPPPRVVKAPRPAAPAAVTQPPPRVAKAPQPAAVTQAPRPAPAAEPGVADQLRLRPEREAAAVLVPREDAVRLPQPELPRGQTIHNRPEELPDPAALLAQESEVAQRRVDGWAQKALARGRVENGVVSYYFHDLRHRLERVIKDPPPFIEPFGLKSLPSHAQQAVGAWSAAARRYGATGSAYEAAAGDRRESEVPNRAEGAHAQQLEAGARLRDFGDGRMGEELIAIVEVRQGSDGALADLSLITPSSSARFDTWVMAQAPAALDGLAAPPDGGVGIHAAGLRSVWAFKGRVTYKRNIKDTELLEDGWYLALTALPGALVGTFDETTGKLEYVDLRHPRYECNVQLLEVY